VSTVAAIHQPNYLPWPGFFHKLAAADVFVHLDAVQFPRGQSFAARNRIKTPNGVTFLTVPVTGPKDAEGTFTYLEAELADDRWRKKHLRTVEQSYAKAPHFEEVFELYRREVERGQTFVGLTIGLIDAVAAYLGIETRRVRLSELLPAFGQKTQLIVDVCGALDADVYLSGSGGGRDYNDEGLLREHGIELRYDEYAYPEHPQLWDGFESNLSVLDVLFNCGPAARPLVVGE
jgi:hypothetical protein